MWSLTLQSLLLTALQNLKIPAFFHMAIPLSIERNGKSKLVLTCWLLRTVWVFWGRLEVYCDTRTRGTCQPIREIKGVSTCNYSSCCSVCHTSADRNHLGKMHLKCLDTGTGSIGPSLLCDQVASTVQVNGDLETSWTAANSPQTVPWQNDVTICLEIDCVNTPRRVSPGTPARTSGPASPAITVS